MLANKRLERVWLAGALVVALAVLLLADSASCQRDGDDDFDDSGFDDSGYSSPQNQDTESSNQNPSNYSPANEEDMDDDDDVDETHVRPQVAPDGQQEERRPLQSGYYDPQERPQRFYSPANSVLLANVDPQAANHMRYRRSTGDRRHTDEEDVEDAAGAATGQRLIRHRRHSKYIGPVYTYVKTDKYARFKWGVKHKVGKHGKHG